MHPYINSKLGRPLLCFYLFFIFSNSAQAKEYNYADAHLHYVDFFQQSDGSKALLKQMDNAGVEHVMLSGMPVIKKWGASEPKQPRYYLSDDAPLYWYSMTDAILAEAVQELPKNQQQRIHPFLSGFDPTDLHAARQIEQLIELYPGFWQGVGEVLTRHDVLTAMTDGERPRADHKAMMKVYKVAAKYDLPVMLHSNVTSEREPSPLYLPELENVLKKNPDTKIIWAHAGTSSTLNTRLGRLKFLQPELERLLSTYPNLWIDLSWTVLDPYILDKKGNVRAEWAAMIKRHPDRFMIGSDMVGRFGNMRKHMKKFNFLLDALPQEVAQKLARDNFLAVLPDKPAQKI